jgi:acetyl esterase
MLQTLKVSILRRYYKFISRRAWKRHLNDSQPGQPVLIPGPSRNLQGRLYPGARHAALPLVLYFHGGGWVIGNLDTHDPFCRALCEAIGCSVLAIDYRLAPEHPFPAAQDDALAAARWVASSGDRIAAPGNGSVIIAGDSAGGQLACCTCLDADPDTRAAIVGEVLIYPVCDHYSTLPPSYVERAKGQTLTSSLMVWFWDTYLGDYDADAIPTRRAMPLRADNLGTLPATFLVTAEFDPLRDEGRALADRLSAAGIDLQYRHHEDAAHGFACSEGPTADCMNLLADLAAWVDKQAGA